MIAASLLLPEIESPEVVCLGAHCDDIEIGCGGTLMALAETCPNAAFTWIIFCGDERRAAESRQASASLLGDSANVRMHFLELRDGFLPYDGGEAKSRLREISKRLDADVVFTHYRDDAHQDHRLVSELTANEFRDQLILEYEVPKYDGDLGSPNVFVPLDHQTASRKIDVVLESFASQIDKHWFSRDTFEAIMHLRGIEAGRSVQFAEAFYCRKMVLQNR
jgi:LmbE family N-acetylglucosaminyl deacetylase